MELRHAVPLFAQSIAALKETTDVNVACKMAQVVTILGDVIPSLLRDDLDKEAFDKFLETFSAEIKVAGNLYQVSLSAQSPIPRCLNDKTFVSCGGPPKSYSKCDRCGKTGKP